MRVPAAALAAIGARLVFLRYNRDLPAVQELKHEEKNLISHRVHRYDSRARPSRRGGWAGAHPERVLRIGPAEELAEEEAPGSQNATVRVDHTPLHAEGDVAEGLPVDQQIQVV